MDENYFVQKVCAIICIDMKFLVMGYKIETIYFF